MDDNAPVTLTQDEASLHTTTTVVSSFESVYYSGPLPPASELKELEKLVPGIAERLLVLTEKEQETRHALAKEEMDVTKTITKLAARGQTYVFICVLASFVAAAVCAYFKAYAASATAAGVAGVISYLTFSDKVKKS